ncbi:hypothetical protein L1987_13554 [Smallanthus sonchifolius]|uniref:Uncharacterized protein n=1 Tax=Smallanthus sonchifolius TaxID=185202 RepID=A0ACB9JJ46_9ASTR|nr:hypothetical protein L1987_13554 [Smallanthus sonchifolius]
MDTKGRLVAGSHNRNEFVLINVDEVGRLTLGIENEALWEDVARDDEGVESVGAGGGKVGESVVSWDEHGGSGGDESGIGG